MKPRPGHARAFEEGTRAHFDLMRRQQVPAAWLTWASMTGENTGGYYVGTLDHTWADFDRRPTMAGAMEWEGLVGEIVEAARGAGWGMTWGTFQLVNGGELPQYVIAIAGERFADFEEPSPNMGEMLARQLGQQRAQEIFQRIGELTEWEKSEMIAWREDLSYIP